MTGPSSTPSSRLASFIDRLYAAPLDAFTATRKALVAELRGLGAGEEAKLLSAVRKPSRSAWALDKLARDHPADLQRFLAATERVREAQALAVRQLDPAALREAVRVFKANIAEIVALAARELGQAGGATPALERAIGATLQALPFATREEIDALTRGTLGRDLEPASDFAIFGLVPPPPAAEEPPVNERATNGGDAAARERARAEARRVAAEARRRAREAARLAKIAEEAEREATRLEEEAAAAAAHARALEEQARAARTEATRARTAARPGRG